MKNPIVVKTTINEKIDKVWKYWSEPKHIEKWNTASDDWHTVNVENELKKDGEFKYRMEAKDGSMGFDFGGRYTNVEDNELIHYILDDGRNVKIEFKEKDGSVNVIETFEPESENPIEMQKNGWQAILDNFKKYAEN